MLASLGATPPPSATAASLRGLRDAGARAATAAAQVAAAGAPVRAGAAPAPETAGALLAAGEGAPDPARALVDLKLAQRAYEASAATFRTADETTAALLRAL